MLVQYFLTITNCHCVQVKYLHFSLHLTVLIPGRIDPSNNHNFLVSRLLSYKVA